MRKRYQTIQKRGQESVRKVKHNDDNGVSYEKNPARYDRNEPSKIDLLSQNADEIPPVVKDMLAGMLMHKKQNKNNATLMKFMLIATAVMAFIAFTINGQWTSVGGELLDSFVAILVVGVVLSPVIFFMMLLNKVLPAPVVGWIGAIIIIFMAMSFVGYIASNWGY